MREVLCRNKIGEDKFADRKLIQKLLFTVYITSQNMSFQAPARSKRQEYFQDPENTQKGIHFGAND